jgi:hypothetical protein
MHLINQIKVLHNNKWSLTNIYLQLGPSWPWSYHSLIDDYLYNWCLSLLTLWVRIQLRWVILDTTLYDKVCSWLTTSLWFSPVTSVSIIYCYVTLLSDLLDEFIIEICSSLIQTKVLLPQEYATVAVITHFFNMTLVYAIIYQMYKWVFFLFSASEIVSILHVNCF